jgi:hypothetical protein
VCSGMGTPSFNDQAATSSRRVVDFILLRPA